jgi:hypothetical protein
LLTDGSRREADKSVILGGTGEALSTNTFPAVARRPD